jgi:hypothetical protein
MIRPLVPWVADPCESPECKCEREEGAFLLAAVCPLHGEGTRWAELAEPEKLRRLLAKAEAERDSLRAQLHNRFRNAGAARAKGEGNGS